MVRFPVFRVAACVALLSVSAAALPLAAPADTTPAGATEYHFSTAITTVYGSQYPIAGHLDLEIFPAGNLRGYYHNAFQKAFIQVVGGRDGSYIWFDIGPSPIDLGLGIGTGELLHIVANFDPDGSFKGQAFPRAGASTVSTAAVTSDAARPAANASALISPSDQATAEQQYIFSAKPMEPGSEDYSQPSPAP